ncbi:gluconate 2-dehydrogenase subunit 3 family protein [Thalassotalea piscium]
MTEFLSNKTKNTLINAENTRRDFLKKLTGVIGGTAAYALLAGDNLAVALAYQQKQLPDKQPKLFSSAQLTTLASVCQTVIPKTDTLGAADVDCHGFIDHQLLKCHPLKEQQNCIEIINKIEAISQQHLAQSFHLAEQTKQTQLLNDLENHIGFTPEDSHQFQQLKSLIVFGYFTSEVGATQALNYQAIPGGYKGSIPYNENSKAWGSLGFY